MPIRPSLLFTTALTSLGFAWIVSPSLSADIVPLKAYAFEPAVSGINYKLGGFGGALNTSSDFGSSSNSLGGATGSFTLPVGRQFGLQVDGIGGSWGGRTFYGTGGHLFWRDPNRGMLGVYGSWLKVKGDDWMFLNVLNHRPTTDVSTAMAEGAYYLSNLTLRALVGWEGDGSTSRFTSRTDLAWYATRDLELSIGHRYVAGHNALALGTEWLTPYSLGGPGVRPSLFAEARLGGKEYTGVWGGLRVFFGKSRTLIDKQRRDDPPGDPNIDNLIAQHSVVKGVFTPPTSPLTSCSTCTFIPPPPSDVRLKRDIELLAHLPNGIGLYRYRYLWSDTVYVGVMAQEVAQIVPDAVLLADDGYLRVDYGRLGLRLLTFDEWMRGSRSARLLAA